MSVIRFLLRGSASAVRLLPFLLTMASMASAQCSNTSLGNGVECVAFTSNSDSTGNDFHSLSAASSLNVQAGDTLVVAVRYEANLLTSINGQVGVQTSAGDILNYATGTTGGGSGWATQIFYICGAIANPASTVTVYFDSAHSYPSIIVHQYRGLIDSPSSTSCLDTTSTGTSTGSTTATSGAFTTTQANELAFAVGGDLMSGTAWTAGAGYTLVATDPSGIDASEHQALTAIQTGATASINLSKSSANDIVVATFIAGTPSTGSGLPAGHGAYVWAATTYTSTECGGDPCVLAVSDSKGNTYSTLQTNNEPSVNVTNFLAFGRINTSLAGDGSDYVRCSFFEDDGVTQLTTAINYCRLLDMSNVAGTGFLDSSAQSNGSGTLADSGPLTVTSGNTDLIFSIFDLSATGVTVTPASGFTGVLNSPDGGGGAQYAQYSQVTTGTDPSITLNPGTSTYGAGAAIKESSTGGSVTSVNNAVHMGLNSAQITLQVPPWYAGPPRQTATLTNPKPGGVLPGSSVTFSWTAGTEATAYWLYLGTTGAGSANVFNSGSLNATSVTVSTLPTNGVTIYVTLFSSINGSWVPESYTYAEAGSYTLAALTNPAPGATLAGASGTFTWSPGAGPTAYWLYLGTTGPGSANLYSSGSFTGTSVTVNGLPTNGVTIYAALFSEINGAWQPVNYTFTEAGTYSLAQITNPPQGGTLAGSSVGFSWNIGAGPTAYEFWLGTTGVGTSDLYNSGQTNSTSANLSGLPTNGVTIYATLWSKINGMWESNSYTFTEAGTPVLAALTTPSPGGVLSGSSVGFLWSLGAGPTAYEFWLGTTGVGTSDLYNSGQTNSTSANLSGLPTNGVTIYATLWSKINGLWKSNSYTFTEAGTPVLAALTAPSPGGVLSGSSATFTWTAGAGPTQYDLWLGTTGVGSANVYNSGSLSGTSLTVNGLPANGVTIYATLFSEIDGAWQPASDTYTESGSYTLASMTSPMQGATLPGTSVMFTWLPGAGPTGYWLYLGTTGPGSTNLYSSGSLTGTSVTVNGLPTNGGTIYATLFSKIDGAWQPASYTYTAQ